MICRFARFLDMPVDEKVERHLASLKRHLTGDNPKAEARILEEDGVPIGYCVFYWTFATFQAEANMFVEDLFVGGDDRGLGLGVDLLAYLNGRAKVSDSGKIHLCFPADNEKLREYYTNLGFELETDWSYMFYPVKRLLDRKLPRQWAVSETED